MIKYKSISHRCLRNRDPTLRLIQPHREATTAPQHDMPRSRKLDCMDMDVIRRVVHSNFKSKKLVTLDGLLEQLKGPAHGFTISRSTLWCAMKKIGFTYI